MTATSIREATITTIQQSALRWRRQQGWRATKSAIAARAMATTKRVAGERRQRRRRGWWRQQRGRQVTKRAMVRGESDGDADKESDGGGNEGGR